MDTADRLPELWQQVLACLHSNPLECQFKCSCLAAAALHYRRASVVTPFPTGLGFETAAAERDYASLQRELQSLPSLASLAAAGAAGGSLLTLQQVRLLHWLLCGVLRPASGLRAVSLDEVAQSLLSLGNGWLADLALNPATRPQQIIALQAAQRSLAGDRLLAFHGSSFENMHSILHNGLLNMSGTRLERTGAAFGQGIYLSTELSVAFAFGLAADACRSAALGGRLRCLLVCSVAEEHAKAAQGDGVPEKYLVVQRSDAITPIYAFLYSDDGGSMGPHPAAAAQATNSRQLPLQQQHPAAQTDRPILLYIVLVYVLWMLLRYSQENWYFMKRSFARLLM